MKTVIVSIAIMISQVCLSTTQTPYDVYIKTKVMESELSAAFGMPGFVNAITPIDKFTQYGPRLRSRQHPDGDYLCLSRARLGINEPGFFSELETVPSFVSSLRYECSVPEAIMRYERRDRVLQNINTSVAINTHVKGYVEARQLFQGVVIQQLEQLAREEGVVFETIEWDSDFEQIATDDPWYKGKLTVKGIGYWKGVEAMKIEAVITSYGLYDNWSIDVGIIDPTLHPVRISPTQAIEIAIARCQRDLQIVAGGTSDVRTLAKFFVRPTYLSQGERNRQGFNEHISAGPFGVSPGRDKLQDCMLYVIEAIQPNGYPFWIVVIDASTGEVLVSHLAITFSGRPMMPRTLSYDTGASLVMMQFKRDVQSAPEGALVTNFDGYEVFKSLENPNEFIVRKDKNVALYRKIEFKQPERRTAPSTHWPVPFGHRPR